MAKRQNDDSAQAAAEGVEVRISRDGVAIPTSADTSVMRELTDDVLRGIGDTGDAFADALAIAEQLYGSVQDITEEFGTGFELVSDKNSLVGVKFVLLKWNFTQGDFGVFVSAAVVTAKGRKYILNDGSTGICQQLREFSMRTGKFGGFVAPRGLRSSQYATCQACGKPRSSFDETCPGILQNGSVCGDTNTARGTGSTYYLDTAAVSA
jgi:hypothetical protein